MSATLVWTGGLKFTGKNSDGHETSIDGDRKIAASVNVRESGTTSAAGA